MSASLFGINVDLAIINKIMPHQTTDQYYANWAEFQEGKVEEARANFYPLSLKEIRLHDTELRGLEMLRKNGELLFEMKILHEYTTGAFNFATEENSLRMTVKVLIYRKR